MKVAELMEYLEFMDPEATVLTTHDYGDRGHTLVAQPISYAEDGRVTHSAYHNMDRVILDDDDRDTPESPIRNVVLLFK